LIQKKGEHEELIAATAADARRTSKLNATCQAKNVEILYTASQPLGRLLKKESPQGPTITNTF
jgi:ribosomal protein L7Ae-like RNA K-turn-binding protein